jgi:universal stress protein A
VTYNKILFATDFSPASDVASEYAVSLARESGATLLLAHVEEPMVSYFGGEMVMVQSEQPNPILRRMLEERAPKAPNVKREIHLLHGSPANEIVRLANDGKVDLVVIGTHGRTGLTRLLMGSVAESIMRHAKCPVLVVKAAQSVPQPTRDESFAAGPTLTKNVKGE